MKIVHITNNYEEKLGYQEESLVKALGSMDHENIVITSDWHYDYPDYDNTVRAILGDKYVGPGLFVTERGTKIYRLKSYKKIIRGSIYLWGLEKCLISLKPDFVICHGLFQYYAIQVLCLKKLNCPIVFDEHTALSVVRKGFLSSLIYSIFRNTLSEKFLARADKIVGVSDSVMVVLKNYFGLTGDKVEMIPLGSDTEIFRKDDRLRNVYRKKLDVLDDTIVITYTGKMYYDKKVHLLLEALNDKSVYKERKICINLVGSVTSDYQEILGAAISSSKHKVNATKAVSVNGLPEVYNGSDICVWPDHTTTSTVDATACGCPIICSHYLTERVKYNNGLIIKGGDIEELKEALRLLINDDSLRMSMSMNGLEYVDKELSWKIIAKKFLLV